MGSDQLSATALGLKLADYAAGWAVGKLLDTPQVSLSAYFADKKRKNAFADAVGAALQDFAANEPELIGALFDETFLNGTGGEELRLLLSRARTPDPARLAAAYRASSGLPGGPVLEEKCAAFIDLLDGAIREQPFLWPIIDARERSQVATDVRRLAASAPADPSGFSGQIRAFVEDYLGTDEAPVPFGGRGAEIVALNDWLADPGGPRRLLVTAPAGRGKSALLVRWYKQIPLTWKQVFVPISIRRKTSRPAVFLQALAARLAAAMNESLTRPASGEEAAFYADKINEFLLDYDADTHGRLVVVLDGLDEAAGVAWLDGLFPRAAPKGLKILASARIHVGMPDPERWLARLGWPSETAHMAVPPLDTDGIAQALGSAGPPLAALAEDSSIVSELARLTDGDPLLVKLYADRLRQDEAASAGLRVEDLSALQPGYGAYFRRWFDDQAAVWEQEGRDPRHDARFLATVAILGQAKAPLLQSDLRALLERATGEAPASTINFLRPLARFIEGDGREQGLVFAHPKLADFFGGGAGITGDRWDDLDDAVIESAKAAFVEWGRETVTALDAAELPPQEAPTYLLDNYLAHLLDSAPSVDDLMALTDEGWLRAWEAYEGGYSGFAGDVYAVWQGLKHLPPAQPIIEGWPPNPAGQLRCVLILSSIRTLSANIPPVLLRAALEHGLISARQALNLIGLRAVPTQRAWALAELFDLLDVVFPDQILEMIFDLADMPNASRALTRLAPYLPANQCGAIVDKALDGARQIAEAEHRARALADLAPHVPVNQRVSVLREAFDAAREVSNPEHLVWTLGSLAPQLPADQRISALNEALNAARESEIATIRALALADLAPLFPTDQRHRLLHEALCIAWEIEEPYHRARTLTAVARHLPVDQRDSILRKAFDAAHEISNLADRVQALTDLVPYLTADQRDSVLREGLDASQTIGDEYSRARALTAVARHLPTNQRRTPLREALHAAREIGEADSRIWALATLAPHLPADLLREALDAAREIGDAGNVALALVHLAPKLPPNQRNGILSEALNAVRRISDTILRYQALTQVAPVLAADQRFSAQSDILDDISNISNPSFRAQALVVVVPKLSGKQRQRVLGDALRAAREIEIPSIRARALVDLASHLPTNQRNGAIREAINAARATDADERAATFTDLASLMPVNQRQPIVSEALDAVIEIQNMMFRAQALTELATQLPTDRLSEAFNAARGIADAESRACALAGLAIQLPPDQRDDVLCEAFNAAREIADAECLAWMLADLAPDLPPNQQGYARREALATARQVADARSRAHILMNLAPQLPAGQRECVLNEVRNAIREITNAWFRAHALTELIPHLPENKRDSGLIEGLDTAMEIANAEYCARALVKLARHLQTTRLQSCIQGTLDALAWVNRDKTLEILTELCVDIDGLEGSLAADIVAVSRWWP